MIILFQDDYFPEEKNIWEKYGAVVVHGLHGKNFNTFEPILARGTIAFDRSVKQTLRSQGWPDITWPLLNDWKVYNYDYLLNCSDLLNSDAHIYHNDSEWSDNYPMDDVWSDVWFFKKRWIRSNSGSKLFTGGIFDEPTYIVERDYLEQHNLKDIEFVTAEPKIIGKEWRLIIINDTVISGSLYMDKGEVVTDSKLPQEVVDFATEWVKKHHYLFPQGYVLDVCEHEDQYKVVEVNNLLTSGWYNSDIDKIVYHITHLSTIP